VLNPSIKGIGGPRDHLKFGNGKVKKEGLILLRSPTFKWFKVPRIGRLKGREFPKFFKKEFKETKN